MARKIVVIGAGPAGMTAAIEAARRGQEVILLERNKQSGKKLRISGGGRGNLTNARITASQYYSNDFSFVRSCLSRCGFREIQEYLRGLGILTYQTDDGWVYPVSNSASNVADLLEARLIEAEAELRLNANVTRIRKLGAQYELSFSDEGFNLICDRLVIACGGKAYPQTGSDGSLFKTIEKLGHSVFPIHPALAPVLLDMKAIHGLQGLRMDAGVSLWKRTERISQTYGNILFTNWGINGPGAMDLSHWVSLYGVDDMQVEINFIAGIQKDAEDVIFANSGANISVAAILGAFLPPKAVMFFLKKANLGLNILMGSLSKIDLEKILQEITRFRVAVKGVKEFDHCQVSTGGISLGEVDPLTMQSLLQPGLYFAGEVLDVIGPCGGYNLHWAFCSGLVAGRSCGLV